MDRLMRDVRFAMRGFRRTPGFAVATILILGIGIGMAAATVTVYDAVLLRKLPVIAQDRVVLPRILDKVGVALDVQPPQLAAFNREARTMQGVAGVTHGGANDSPFTDGTRSLMLRMAGVTGNFFDVLNTRPIIGRLIATRDDVTGAPNIMVLSYGAWQRQFHGDSSVVGRRLNSPYYPAPFTIVGVAPPGLDYPAGIEAWIAATPAGGGMMNVVARLAPSASPAVAGAELFEFMKRDPVMRTYMSAARSNATTLPQAIVGDVKPALSMLAAAVGLLLLIVCVNIGNLLLSRAASRSRELAVRRALGASSGDITRQLFVESAVLAVAGGLFGLACAEGLVRAVIVTAPSELPRLDMVRLGGAPLAWCAATTLLTLLVFGLAPALLASGRDLATPLRFDSRSGRESKRSRRFRQTLVASQVALALVVLVGGSLLARSFIRLERIHLGYAPDNLSFLSISISWERLGKSQSRIDAVYDDLSRQLHAVPGVVATSPVLVGPYIAPDMFLTKVVTETGPSASSDRAVLLPVSIGGPELLRTFGIGLIRGREFLPAEVAEGAARVAILSEATARLLWPGQDAIGKRFRSTFDSSATAWVTVVGVADNVRYRRLKEAQPMMYVPWREFAWGGSVAIRTTRPLASMQHELERAVHAANPNIDLWATRAANEFLDTVLAQPRLSATLLSALGLVATLLAAIGLYAIMAAAVREQTREIGVRMALGATPERVRSDVLRAALSVTAVGAVVGLGVAIVGTQLLAKLLFEVSPTDPLSIGGACALLVVTAAAAAYVPARRATRIDPVQALRAD
ncbi:MAG: ADOP family duplicated permease [bacterium]